MAKIDDSVKKKVPELRFKGFTDDWEERKVGNFLSESKIKGSDGSVSKKLTVKLWRKGIVPKEEIYKGSSATQYYIRLAGQFMYGKLDFLNQAFGILPKELDGYESTLDSPAFDFKDGINPNFFLEYVCQENFYKYQGNIANGSRKAKRIHADTFFDMPITIPSFEEQEKIGNFFKELDDAIALHQRKLDLLKEQKKGYLQKMFPKNGAKVPELRFAGFADDWEERKLGEHAKYRRGSFPQPYGNKEWYDGEGAMPFVQVVDVTNKLTLVENTKQKISKLAQSKSVFVPKGTVVVTLQGSIGRVAITQYDSFVDRTLLIFEDYEKETDERFWAYTIQKKFEIEKLKAPGGTIKTITKEALSSFDVHLPQFKEQAKIGSFFKQLDDTIALHQRKLDLLKEQKKGFLQKMFV